MKQIYLCIIVFFIHLGALAQSEIFGKITLTGTNEPLIRCRIVTNNKEEYFTDSIGNFRITTVNKRRCSLKITYIGCFPLMIKNLPLCEKKLDLGLIPLIVNTSEDNYYVAINNSGSRDKKGTKRLNKTIIRKNHSLNNGGFIIFKGKKYYNKNGIIRITSCC